MADTPEEIQKHMRAYLKVGAVLLGGTILTVVVAKGPEFSPILRFLDFGPHGLSGGDIFVGLCIAIIKASLVALIFMHLNAEKSLIYKFLLFTVFFFFGLMFLTLFEVWDPIQEQFSRFGSD